MKILVKYPTRQRPELFLNTLKDYFNSAEDNGNITYLISYDKDDMTMSDVIIKEAQSIGENIIVLGGYSDSKIHACNRDVDILNTEIYDIIILISDDMHVQVNGWDSKIRKYFKDLYPDTDGCLWLHDGSKQRVISTLTCMGKKFYQRFNYLYHPSYSSFFCDNEYTEVAKGLNKMTFIPEVLIKHQHPQWGGSVKYDALYEKNNSPWDQDQNNYHTRKSLNFPL